MSDLRAKLGILASDARFPGKIRAHAKMLHQRLDMSIKIGVGGPDIVTAGHLLESVAAQLLDAVVSDRVEDADIAVWCTQVFGAEETVFWDKAPASLQDHSLLVGPETPHIQSMSSVYFRQLCAAHAVTDVLKRQVQWAREADTDQAAALLARHPVTCTALPVAEDGIVTYMQTQADALFALDVADTPETCDAVLALCNQTVQHLSDLVTALPDKGLHDAVFDAVDSMTLMTLEGDTAAAADAVTLLIDLQKQFKTRVRQIETIPVP